MWLLLLISGDKFHTFNNGDGTKTAYPGKLAKILNDSKSKEQKGNKVPTSLPFLIYKQNFVTFTVQLNC